jgi:hypothetical protein
MAFRKFDIKLNLSDIINMALAVIGIIIAVKIGANTDQLVALKNLGKINNQNLNALQNLVGTSNKSLNTLKNLTNTSNDNLNTLNDLLQSNQRQLQGNELMLTATNKNLNELAKAVDAIVLSDTQLVYVNRELQLQTDSLIHQTNLLAKSIEISNEILSSNKHRDSAQFINSSYELEDLLNKIDKAYYPVSYLSDSLTLIHFIDSTLSLFNIGLENYCVNEDNNLFTGWRLSIQILNRFKKLVEKGYPDSAELKQTSDLFQSQWMGNVQILKADGRYLDSVIRNLK